MSVQYSGDKITFSDGSTLGSGWTGFKNRIINGDMRIAQRGTTSSGIGSSAYATVDRFVLDTRINASPTGSYTQAQSTDAPNGFKNSFSVTVSTAGNSLSSSYALNLCHFIEGFNVADLAWGTSSAQPVTLSFWIKASIAGVYSFALINAGYGKSYVANYTVNNANTWEYKSVTITGETTGTWDSTTGRGIQIKFALGTGSNYVTSSPNTWVTGEYVESSTASASAAFWNTTGATWKITGVQLEKGSTATSFDYRPYGTELALCHRYYYSVNATGLTLIGGSSTVANGTLAFPVTMRATATITGQTINRITNYAVVDYNGSYIFVNENNASLNHTAIRYNQASGSTWSTGVPLAINPTGQVATITASAEL